jgi:hypothetical protein
MTASKKFTEGDLIPIKRAHLASYKIEHANLGGEIEEEIVIGTTGTMMGRADVLEITSFPKEMKGCIELDEELDRYFTFLSKLSREELLAIVKYEVFNRVLMEQDLDLSLEKTNE